MKKVILALVLGTIPFIGFSQDNLQGMDKDVVATLNSLQERPEAATSDTIWKFGGTAGINFTQSHFSNWAAGGQNTVTATAMASLFAKYAKDRHSWDNTLDLAYGLLSQDKKSAIKADDKIDLASKYGFQLNNPNWYYSALLSFRTQFAPGYEIENGEEVGLKTSDFMAPATVIFSLGMDYKPNDHFSALLSPLTSKLTIVNDDRLASNYGLDVGKNIRSELGAYVKLTYQKDIFENVNLLSKLDLFSNYLEDPKNIDVNWEVLISMKVNNWLTASISTHLIYDDNTHVVVGQREFTANGETVTIDLTGPRTQFKEVFALGLSYKF